MPAGVPTRRRVGSKEAEGPPGPSARLLGPDKRYYHQIPYPLRAADREMRFRKKARIELMGGPHTWGVTAPEEFGTLQHGSAPLNY